MVSSTLSTKILSQFTKLFGRVKTGSRNEEIWRIRRISHFRNISPEHHINQNIMFQTFKAMEIFTLSFLIKCIISGSSMISGKVCAGRLRPQQRHAVYHSDLCLSGVSWVGRSAGWGKYWLLIYPMSTMGLFLNDRPQTALQFHNSPRVHKILPLKKLPGSLGFCSVQVNIT